MGTKNLPPKEWFLGFQLPKLNEEIHEGGLENNDSIIENLCGEPSLTELKGELETAVSKYLNQVKELGIYPETSSRDNTCQFTTFKTPALPRKTIKPNAIPDEQLLDVKFQLTNKTSSDPTTCENFSPEPQGLDNPLYLSLSECSTGNFDKSKETYYENVSTDNSDEDHIYENVEHHLYDTISNPPRPKLPPKPGHLSNVNKASANNKTIKKSHSFPSQNKYEKFIKENNDKKTLKLYEVFDNSNNKKEEKSLILEGSETSDLGSSGTEDTTSEEDWPLPPFPLETEEPSEDTPLPPPPPEIALQQLEENVNQVDIEKETLQTNKSTEESEVDKKDLEDNPNICKDNTADAVIETTLKTPTETIPLELKLSKESGSDIDETNLQLFRTESFSRKHLKSKIFTLNKGLNAYQKATKDKDGQIPHSKFVVLDDGSDKDFETPSVRHSVIIELKDSSSSVPSSLQEVETQIREKLETLKHKPKVIPEIKGNHEDSESETGSVCVNIKQDNVENSSSNSDRNTAEDLNEQVIEIAEDGSWEMKDFKSNSKMELSAANNSPDIDPFTGLPILAPNIVPEPILPSKETVKEYIEPEVYFDDKTKTAETTNISENSAKDDVSGAYTCVSANDLTSLSPTVTDSVSEEIPETPTTTSLSETNEEEKPISSLSDCVKSPLENEKTSKDAKETVNFICNEEKSILSDCPKKVDENPKSQCNQINLGAAIMEGYERDLRRKKDDLNLPEVSLLEFGDAVKDLEIQRKTVIEQMTVKAKKKDSWIRTFRSPTADTSKEPSKAKKDIKDPSAFSNKKNLFENKDNPNNKKVTTNEKSLDTKSKQMTKNEKPESKNVPESSVSDTIDEVKLHKQSNEETSNTKNDKNQHDEDNEDKLVKEKNDINTTKNNSGKFLGKCLYNNSAEGKTQLQKGEQEHLKTTDTEIENELQTTKGEVDSGSILNKKEETKSYWETKMLATVDDNGWEPVANVKFRTETQNNNVEESANTVPPPPEFSADSGNSFESLSSREDFSEQQQPPAPQGVKNERPARQYVYGADEENKNGLKTGSQTLKIASSHENIIEAEIREQQLREEELRRENDLRNREKTGGASSPSSHTSDEGFVDRPIEEVPSPPLTSSSPSDGFTHTLKGSDGEAIIYDAVSPPSDYFTEKPVTPNGSTSEAKIALEIRELKEREAELRAIRELREREQHLRTMRDCISEPRSHPAEVEEENEEVERVSSSSREILEDHLTSLTTTTDEGNFSECGDPGSSEDKSSDGSNSRIMSPDLHSFGSHAENRQRKVTVKPFEDDDSEAQPVYTQMKKESVIEREIRLAKEREEAFRREKGLTIPPSPSTPKSNRVSPALQSPQPSPVTNSNIVNGEEKAPKNAVEPPKNEVEPPKNEVEPPKQAIEPPKRGVQHRLATSRIQQEIEETSQRERELRNAGKILTLSEDTVDSKVTRLSDFVTDQESTTPRASSISSVSSFSSLNSSPSRGTLPNAHTPLNKRNTSPLSNFSSPYSPPTFTPSPSNRPPTPTRLTRSFSTNNLSLSGTHPGGLRAPQKGLMQKFIASRGKMTGSAFAPPTSPTSTLAGGKPPPTTANGIPTRPMRVSPKAPVVRREIENKTEDQQQSKIYRRTHATAEEKIQEELREMKKREEELRRLRARNLARSQPNLAGIDDDVDEEELTSSEGVDSSSFLHEVNGLRTALSNPNLLDDESEQTTQAPQTERGVRRRSALIAQWEGRIQQTAET